MPNPILTFHYGQNVSLTTKQKSFREAVIFVLDRKEPTEFTPLKLVVESTGKTFYFDEQKFKKFIANEITQQELLFETECNGLYRNQIDIPTSKTDIIDSGSLWMLRNQSFILIDEDRTFLIKAPDVNFIEI